MGHYRLADNMPSAIILAKNPRSGSLDELKTYQDNIFLNNGTEFQIKLFNPLQEKIGARISMNGKTSNHLLVLKPGEDIVVDRFIDEQKRMKFDTYEYDSGNSQSEKAVQQNGIIEISFFKEYTEPIITSTTWYDYSTTGTVTLDGTFTNIDIKNGNSRIYTTGNVGISNINPTNTLNINDSLNLDGTSTNTNNVFLGQSAGLDNQNYATLNNTTGMGNVKLDTFDNEFVSPGVPLVEKDQSGIKTRSVKTKKLTKSLRKETGRVEKGEKSEQQFESVELKFNNYSFHTIRYNLKPMSEKVTQSTEIRDYCTDCGYRLRNKSWSFCPKCGNKV